MKVYLRLLSFAKPIEKYAIPYFVFSILGITFGLLNFTLLVPVFDILFDTSANSADSLVQTLPAFSADIDYVKNVFYYFLSLAIKEYGNAGALNFVCLIIVISVMLSNVFKYLSQRIMENLRINTLLNLRKAVFNKTMDLHLGFFSNERKGDIISKITADVQVIQTTITNTMQVVFKEPITIIAYFIVLFSMSVELTLFTILVIPVSGLVISLIVKRLKRQASEAQSSFGTMLSFLDEALSGIRVIKAFNALNYSKKKFHDENERYSGILRSMARRQQLASPVSEFLGVSTVALILVYGGSLVIGGKSDLSASSFVAYIIVFSQILIPAKSITNSFSNIQHGIASGERVFELLDLKVELTDKPDAIELKGFKNAVVFKDVHFSYGEKEVLKGIDFELKKGMSIALVGTSGGGKTTISDLIPRFYDPQQGAVLIDGHDLRDCKIDSARALMGIVTQESILFNDTIFNNIAFGMPNATLEQVINAAKVANAHQFIIESSEGYDSIIGDRGVKLSGGQKQRLSIARAVLRNPPILLLDEATSALDTESEKLVQEALTNLMKNRTSLVIAHRLSTIQHADLILVIQKGKIVERGSHAELIKENGLYQKLHKMQLHKHDH